MGMLVYFNSKLKFINVGVVKTSINHTVVIKIWPEAKWSSLDQVEIFRGPHPCMSNILGWIVARGESPIKLGIAGFPRNLFK